MPRCWPWSVQHRSFWYLWVVLVAGASCWTHPSLIIISRTKGLINASVSTSTDIQCDTHSAATQIWTGFSLHTNLHGLITGQMLLSPLALSWDTDTHTHTHFLTWSYKHPPSPHTELNDQFALNAKMIHLWVCVRFPCRPISCLFVSSPVVVHSSFLPAAVRLSLGSVILNWENGFQQWALNSHRLRFSFSQLADDITGFKCYIFFLIVSLSFVVFLLIFYADMKFCFGGGAYLQVRFQMHSNHTSPPV